MAEQGQVAEQPEQDILSRLSNLEAPEDAPEVTEPEAEEAEAEEPEGEEGEEAAEEAASVAVDPDAPLVEITVKSEDGKEETRLWSLNEMRKGVMMEKDYRRKTAEVARARETFDTEVQQQVSQTRNEYLQGLRTAEQTLLTLVVPELNGVDMDKLVAENPSEAVRIQARAQKLNNAVQHIRQQLAQAETQAMQQLAQQSVKALSDPISGIPGWGDELYNSIIRDGAKHFGFKPEEVANVVDHRMIRVLHAALQHEKAKAAQPVRKAAPKVIKPGAPQGKDDLRAREATNLRQRLKKTGDVRDAAELYLKVTGNG